MGCNFACNRSYFDEYWICYNLYVVLVWSVMHTEKAESPNLGRSIRWVSLVSFFHSRYRIRVEPKLKSWASYRKSHAHSRPWENSEEMVKSCFSHKYDRFQCLLVREIDSKGLINSKKFLS